MSNKVKPSVPRTPRCIWCGGQGLSQEHLWADWMAQHYYRQPTDRRTEVAERYDSRMNAIAGEQRSFEVRGHTVNKKIKVVCKGCNNGWMSGLEEKSKPFLEPMLQGLPVILNQKLQIILMRWLFMKMCVFDNERNVRSMMPAELIRNFYKEQEIPDWTHAFMLKHGDAAWVAQVHRHASGVTFDGHVDTGVRNMQVFTMGIGQLLIFVSQCFVIDPNTHLDPNLSARLWPPSGQSVSWPPPLILPAGGPDQLTQAFANEIQKSLA